MIGWLLFFGALGVISFFLLISIFGTGFGLLAYEAWYAGKRRAFSYFVLLFWPFIKSLRDPVLLSIGLKKMGGGR